MIIHNKTIAFLCLFLLTLSPFVTFATNLSAAIIEEDITIVFTSGMAEIHQGDDEGGYAHLKSLLTTLRGQRENVIFLHGGDVLSPGILSTIDKGAHMISILNDLVPDAMGVSKADLAHQEDALSLRTLEAGFPLTNCNIYDPLTGGGLEGIFAHLLLQAGTLKIGLLSVVDPEVIPDYLPQRISLENINAAVSKNAAQLRQKGADIILLMAGFSIDTFNTHFINPPVDLVLLSPIAGTTGLTQQGNSLFEIKGHSGLAAIIELHVIKDGEQSSLRATSRFEDLKNQPAAPELDKKIASYLKQLSGILDQVLGTTHTQIDTRRDSMRSGENGFANFTADALRESYHSDIAFINAGGFRADKVYPAGSSLTVGDIRKELPFNNRIVNLRVSGETLRKSLENGLSRIEEAKGRFPHISGIKVEYNPNNPPEKRVTSIIINGHPVDPEKKYSMTTLDFLANGGDGYSELKSAQRIVKPGESRLLWEYVKNYIAAKGTISPAIDGRMKALYP